MENDGMTLEEAKRVAALKGDAPIGLVVPALDVLYLELRRLENDRDMNLFAAAK